MQELASLCGRASSPFAESKTYSVGQHVPGLGEVRQVARFMEVTEEVADAAVFYNRMVNLQKQKVRRGRLQEAGAELLYFFKAQPPTPWMLGVCVCVCV